MNRRRCQKFFKSVKCPAELVESLLPEYSGVTIELSRGNTTNRLLIQFSKVNPVMTTNHVSIPFS